MAAQTNFDDLWNYGDPAGTRAKFEALLPEAEKGGDESYHLQLLTQIARTHSLQGSFDEAHALLDRVEKKLAVKPTLVKARYLLERGRSFRSAKQPEKALPLFVQAYDVAAAIGDDFHAIDAVHMIALAEPKFEKKVEWTLKGIALAEKTKVEKAMKWEGVFHNNLGWDFHERKDYKKALEHFEKSLAANVKRGNVKNQQIARWAIARARRSLGELDSALKIQRELEREYAAAGSSDGYVFEEIGELLLAKGDKAGAKPYFAKAHLELAKDDWFAKNEAARLERLKKLSE